jgi:hypothetical protein
MALACIDAHGGEKVRLVVVVRFSGEDRYNGEKKSSNYLAMRVNWSWVEGRHW